MGDMAIAAKKPRSACELTGAERLGMRKFMASASKRFLRRFQRSMQCFVQRWMRKHEGIERRAVVLPYEQQLRRCDKVRNPVPQSGNADNAVVLPHDLDKT